MQKLIDGELHSIDDVYEKHHRLIYKYAHRLSGRVPLEDLVSEGFVGFFEAYYNYDESKGFQFSTYAVRCAYLKMLKLMESPTNGAYYPHHIRELAGKIRKHNDPDAAAQELAEVFGKKEHHVLGALQYLRSREGISIDSEIPLQGSTKTYAEIIPAPYDDWTVVYVNEFYALLTPRERLVLIGMYYEKTQKEIGDSINLTDQTIRKSVKRIREKYREWSE